MDLLKCLIIISIEAGLMLALTDDDEWQIKRNGVLYRAYHQKKSFSEASQICKDDQAELVTIPTKSDNDFVRKNLTDGMWIGLTVTDDWYWPNNKRIFSGVLDDGGEGKTCMMVTYFGGKPRTASCDNTARVVCQQAPVDGECSNGFENVNGICYWVSPKTEMFNVNTEKTCTQRNAELLHPDDNVQVQNVHKANKYDTERGNVWVKAIRKRQFSWTSGTNLLYWSNFAEFGQINQDMCAYMDPSDGLWKLDDCNSTRGFICQRSLNPTDSTTRIVTKDNLLDYTAEQTTSPVNRPLAEKRTFEKVPMSIDKERDGENNTTITAMEAVQALSSDWEFYVLYVVVPLMLCITCVLVIILTAVACRWRRKYRRRGTVPNVPALNPMIETDINNRPPFPLPDIRQQLPPPEVSYAEVDEKHSTSELIKSSTMPASFELSGHQKPNRRRIGTLKSKCNTCYHNDDQYVSDSNNCIQPQHSDQMTIDMLSSSESIKEKSALPSSRSEDKIMNNTKQFDTSVNIDKTVSMFDIQRSHLSPANDYVGSDKNKKGINTLPATSFGPNQDVVDKTSLAKLHLV